MPGLEDLLRIVYRTDLLFDFVLDFVLEVWILGRVEQSFGIHGTFPQRDHIVPRSFDRGGLCWWIA